MSSLIQRLDGFEPLFTCHVVVHGELQVMKATSQRVEVLHDFAVHVSPTSWSDPKNSQILPVGFCDCHLVEHVSVFITELLQPPCNSITVGSGFSVLDDPLE